METIDNLNSLLGDRLKQTLHPGAKLQVAASCFSMFAYEALKEELEKVESVEFIFTSPTFASAARLTSSPPGSIAEKQFNRKVAINQELKPLQAELTALSKP